MGYRGALIFEILYPCMYTFTVHTDMHLHTHVYTYATSTSYVSLYFVQGLGSKVDPKLKTQHPKP